MLFFLKFTMIKCDNMKKIIGIIANTLGFNSSNPFDDKFFVQNQYIEAVYKNGGVPLIVSPINLSINYEILDLCDAFIITGGKRYHKYHFDVIEYVIKTNKKLLGICMGMQLIGMYFNKDYNENTLKNIKNHYYDNITHKNKELLIHDVYIKENSLVFNIFGNKIKTNSIHKQALCYIDKPLKIVGKSDHIIEIIEYKNIIGVQFHPELMNNTKNLFKWLQS